MYYHRALKDSWLRFSRQFPVLLLTGPRQVGKTTFLKHICGKDRNYITLDDPSTRLLANEDPALFLKRFRRPILIDEIQYAPNLLPYIKMEVDSRKQPGDFWLTGSQQFQMMQGVSESLAGRVAIINLLGFSGRERYKCNLEIAPFLPDENTLKNRQAKYSTELTSIYKDIWTGSYPALIAGPAEDRDVYYSSYLQTYLQRDLKDLTQVGDESAFLRFLRACAARTGQLLNISNLANDADIAVSTAKRWLSILQASFVVSLVQPYHSNLTKRLIKAPKMYFLDTGLCSYLTEWSSPETLEAGAMSGAIFETYVFIELLKSWWHKGKSPSIYYYRDKDGKEIDFLIEQDQVIYPIEVKKAATIKRDWIRHFSVLKKLNKQIGDGCVISLCDKSFPIDEKNTALPISII